MLIRLIRSSFFVWLLLAGLSLSYANEVSSLESRLQNYDSAAPKGWLSSLYEQSHYQIFWNNLADQQMLLEHLRSAPAHGLPSATPLLERIQNATGLEREFALSDALLVHANRLRHGVVSPRSADSRWLITKEQDSIPELVAQALAKHALLELMRDLPPSFAGYDALRQQLLHHRLIYAMGGWPDFAAGSSRTLQSGDRHDEVITLRQRLEVTDALAWSADPDYFDEQLVEAVKGFQSRHGLEDDGVVGPRTRAALSVSVLQRIEQILVGMERLRWLPRNINNRAVIVNVPAYRLWLYDKGEVVIDMRTVVGSVRHQTPSFSKEMDYLVLNPNWYVPQSIAAKELVPQLSEDPDLLGRAGYEVYEKGSNVIVDPAAIDWQAVRDGDGLPFRFVQKPGNVNALGSIKFMFPNPYGIYLHDTNAPQLFARERRAFSHGCVRVEKPMELAAAVLGNQTANEVASTIASGVKNRYLYLDAPIPVYLLYLTAWATTDEARFLDDLYGRDSGVFRALQAQGVTH